MQICNIKTVVALLAAGALMGSCGPKESDDETHPTKKPEIQKESSSKPGSTQPPTPGPEGKPNPVQPEKSPTPPVVNIVPEPEIAMDWRMRGVWILGETAKETKVDRWGDVEKVTSRKTVHFEENKITFAEDLLNASGRRICRAEASTTSFKVTKSTLSYTIDAFKLERSNDLAHVCSVSASSATLKYEILSIDAMKFTTKDVTTHLKKL